MTVLGDVEECKVGEERKATAGDPGVEGDVQRGEGRGQSYQVVIVDRLVAEEGETGEVLERRDAEAADGVVRGEIEEGELGELANRSIVDFLRVSEIWERGMEGDGTSLCLRTREVKLVSFERAASEILKLLLRFKERRVGANGPFGCE